MVPLVLYSYGFYRCLPSTWRPREAWNDSPNSGLRCIPICKSHVPWRGEQKDGPLAPVSARKASPSFERRRQTACFACLPAFLRKIPRPAARFCRRDERWTGAGSIVSGARLPAPFIQILFQRQRLENKSMTSCGWLGFPANLGSRNFSYCREVPFSCFFLVIARSIRTSFFQVYFRFVNCSIRCS